MKISPNKWLALHAVIFSAGVAMAFFGGVFAIVGSALAGVSILVVVRAMFRKAGPRP